MAETVASLIERLKEKNQADEVEYVIAKPSGQIVTMEVTGRTAKAMTKMLKLVGDA